VSCECWGTPISFRLSIPYAVLDGRKRSRGAGRPAVRCMEENVGSGGFEVRGKAVVGQ
jgi:hypothetical protein